MIENFDNYKFRCHDSREITASSKITQGAETYLTECFVEAITGVRKQAYGKAIDKGIACEQDGFDMMGKLLYPGKFISKIKEPFENDWIKGTPDCIQDGIVYDIKNAYDLFTFANADLTHAYEWQLRKYMFLTGKKKARLFFCLNNMPDFIIAREEKSLFYKGSYTSTEDTEYIKDCEALREAHNYDSRPIWERFKVWELEHNPADDEKIKAAVTQAREYLNKLLKLHNAMIDRNKLLVAEAHSSITVENLTV